MAHHAPEQTVIGNSCGEQSQIRVTGFGNIVMD
jgi:hypothetical protein